MATIYGRARNPLATRPSPVTGTMAQWKSWADGLTRSERDQLYPGMHIDLIPAYEVINQKAALPDTGTGFGTPMATHPGFAAGAKPVSPFGPSTPQGSSAFTGLFNGGYGGAHSAGLSAPANPQTTPLSPLYGSSPLQTPFQYGAAPASPDPRDTGASTLTPFGATPGRSTPIPPFGNSLQANSGLDINTFASSFASSVQPGNTAGTAIKKGLLDLSYTDQPDGGPTNSLTKKNGIPVVASSSPISQNFSLGSFGNAWDKFTEVVGDAIDVTIEGKRFAEDFAKYMVEAPREVQLEFLEDFAGFLLDLIGPVDVIRSIRNMINNPEERNLVNIGLLIVKLLPIVRAAKAGPKFYKFIDRATRKFRAARRKKGKRNGNRPADVPDDSSPRRREGGNGSGLFTRTPKLADYIRGGLEAAVAEGFGQFMADFDAYAKIAQDPQLAVHQDTRPEFNFWRVLVAFATGGVAGVSAGFESDDAAAYVVQSILDPVNMGANAFLMKSVGEGTPFNTAMAAGLSAPALATAFVKLAKIVIYERLAALIDKRLAGIPQNRRRDLRRYLKIAVNILAEKLADFLIDALD